MRFPRNAKIFRGQIDVAALASVFFLLLLFLIASSLLYIPGIPISLNSPTTPADATRKQIRVTRQGEIVFERRTYSLANTEDLKAHVQRTSQLRTLVVRAETGAPRQLVLVLRDLARDLRLEFETQNVALELPETETVNSSASASLVVVVNLGGQFFFENQLVTPESLRQKLQKAVKSYKSPPTLVIMADKATENGVLIQLAGIAKEAGVQQVIQGVRPRLFEQGRGLEP